MFELSIFDNHIVFHICLDFGSQYISSERLGLSKLLIYEAFYIGDLMEEHYGDRA